MYANDIALKPTHWGGIPQDRGGSALWKRSWQQRFSGLLAAVVAIAVGFRTAAAEPVASDSAAAAPTTATAPNALAPPVLPPSWDLDGTYLWLGPIGAAGYLDATWDSTFGGELAIVRVRERSAVGVIGANLGASRWTAREGGRVWLDGVIGTRVLGKMMGASIGPMIELSELRPTKLGGSIGVWVFAGITPFVRAGAVSDLGVFADLGIHIALPVLRR